MLMHEKTCVIPTFISFLKQKKCCFCFVKLTELFVVVCFDSVRPNKQIFSHVRTRLPGLNKC